MVPLFLPISFPEMSKERWRMTTPITNLVGNISINVLFALALVIIFLE